MKIRRRPAAPPGGEAAEVLEATAARLRYCKRNGLTAVAIDDVLDMLTAGRDTAAVPQQGVRARDPRADVMTGCLPVTPRPGLLPAGEG